MDPSLLSTQPHVTDQGPPHSETIREVRTVTAGEYLDKALHLIGNTMKGAASVVKGHVPREGIVKNALETASTALDKTGEYITKSHPVENVEGVIRKYPIRSLAVCFIAGLLAGNAARNLALGARR